MFFLRFRFKLAFTQMNKAPIRPVIMPRMIADRRLSMLGESTKVALNLSSCTALTSTASPVVIR